MRISWPKEQLWYINRDNIAVNIPTKSVITKDKCGNEQGANSPKHPERLPPLSDMLAIIHTHPGWAKNFPTPGDYIQAKANDLYGIHESGAWVIRKGTAVGTNVITLVGMPPAAMRMFKGGKPC
jgi:hypothetical protein